MSTKSDANITSGLADVLGPTEQVLTCLIASTRGHQQAMAGGVAGMVGGGRAGRALREAADAGIVLSSPMALVLTPSRLLIVHIGNAAKVKEVLGTFGLGEVGQMTVKRLGLGASVTLDIRDAEVRLESRVGASREFAAELERVKSAPA
jgi:hypothetical protein